MSFKTGDPVKVVKALDEDGLPYLGKVGTFQSYAGSPDSYYDYWVLFPHEPNRAGFFHGELGDVDA